MSSLSRSFRKTLFLALAAALLLPSGEVVAQTGFTIEQVMSSAFPTELVAAPADGRLAWVSNERGVRNISVAGPPDYKGAALTRYTDDDGQEITSLVWTPDARAIVFVRGGGPNRQGELPNPKSVPEGVDQAIWVVSVSGGEPRRLGEGGEPAVSPKGDRVAFVNKGQVWCVSLDGSEKAAQLIHARGRATSLTWSPDAARLALVSERGDHSFIGVYDVSAKTLSFLDPSVDRDSEPVWSSDGKQIAFLRQAASRSFFSFGPEGTAEPWSIRIADVPSGKAREAFRAREGRGSAFHEVSAQNQIHWLGDRIVFPWEKDGWVHLYSVSREGGEPLLLTPGEFEVEDVSPGALGKAILFSSNQNDVDRRHLWTVPAAGGAPTALTSGKGNEWKPVETNDGKALAFLRSDGQRPAHAAVRVAGGEAREMAPLASGFPVNALVEPQQVIFPAADGLKIHGQLFLPKTPGEKRPAVIFFHGGSRRQMLLGWHYLSYYHNTYALNQYLASRGYVVLSVNYRSGIGYGLDFREAENYGAHGASEFNDVLGAGLYLRSRLDVDPGRIGLWGGSYGGYLTAMGLSRASDLFAAGVDIHGVHDWNVVIRNFTPSYDPGKAQELARRAFESSPMAAIATWRSPVLLIHGDDDRNVPFSESIDLAEALRKRGVEIEQLVFPDEVHSFLTHARWLQAFRAAADFFDRRLGAKRKTTD